MVVIDRYVYLILAKNLPQWIQALKLYSIVLSKSDRRPGSFIFNRVVVTVHHHLPTLKSAQEGIVAL
jgi:hypothetical protein